MSAVLERHSAAHPIFAGILNALTPAPLKPQVIRLCIEEGEKHLSRDRAADEIRFQRRIGMTVEKDMGGYSIGYRGAK